MWVREIYNTALVLRVRGRDTQHRVRVRARAERICDTSHISLHFPTIPDFLNM
jgi:hypothetical protein